MKSQPALVLASTSVYRRQLLERLRVAFTCRAPGVDEAPLLGETPADMVTRLAAAKARRVAAVEDAWVIGSDQVAVLDDPAAGVLGKPGTAPACRDQLRRCSGRRVSFLTAVAVLRGGGTAMTFTDITRVTFRDLDAAVIERYVQAERPLDCAGGFKSEGLGIALCESIDSTDPTALIGLPLIGVGRVLRSVGFDVP